MSEESKKEEFLRKFKNKIIIISSPSLGEKRDIVETLENKFGATYVNEIIVPAEKVLAKIEEFKQKPRKIIISDDDL